MHLKFTRFLLRQAISSVNVTKDCFRFIPYEDFSEPWTDEKLYKKYGLTGDEISFIESMIRPMDLNTNDDVDE
jgi:site-specific DNA-methyltransferase (adenine-specific)